MCCKALSKVPQLAKLASTAGDKAGDDFNKLEPVEKVVLAGYGALLAGTATGVGYST